MLKICLTGGPGGGKSSVIPIIRKTLTSEGYYVFVCPESATELILNGIKPGGKISVYEFQNFVLDKQIAKENLYDKITKYYDEDRVVVLYDRGLLDACAYIEKIPFFRDMLCTRGLSLSDAYARYDAVFHLVTAADGAENYYQWNNPEKDEIGNNAARSEAPDIAKRKDKLTLASWIGHPHLRVFDNSTDFNGKAKRIMEEIHALLGKPVPVETERKFLIEMPNEQEMASLGCVATANIIQTYLTKKSPSIERRVRCRGNDKEGFVYFYTEKEDIFIGKRIERERKISETEYQSLLYEADQNYAVVYKSRHFFVYDGKYYEMDFYPFSDKHAILEIELHDINEDLKLPPLHYVKEVTGDKKYSNSHIAATLSDRAFCVKQ